MNAVNAGPVNAGFVNAGAVDAGVLNDRLPHPRRDLPGGLQGDETVLWQGEPAWAALARHGFHLGAVALYFAVILALSAARLISIDGVTAANAVAVLELTGLAGAALSLIGLFAWLVSRTTSYTITDRRVVVRFGIAFPVTLNIPFATIAAAGLARAAGGSGDIPLSLTDRIGLGYLILWPHVRPWFLARPQPMLRSVPEVDVVAQILSRALAASAYQPAPAVPSPLADRTPEGAELEHATAGA